MTHTLKLTNGSASLLNSILCYAEALTTVKEKVSAGKIIEQLEDLPESTAKTKQEADEWAKTHWKDIELSESGRDAAKKAFSFCTGKGILPGGRFYNSLAEQLGLEE